MSRSGPASTPGPGTADAAGDLWGPTSERVAYFLGIWFLLSCFVFLVVGSYGLVGYLAAFCGGFGSIAWLLRKRVRTVLGAAGLDNLAGFLLLCVAVCSLEEVLSCLIAGPTSLAIRDLPLDLLWVNAIWLGWLVPWYAWVPRHFSFGEGEALIVGGSSGVLFEVVLSGIVLRPVLALLWIPLAWVVYAVVLLVPLQLVRFPRLSASRQRVPWTLGVTWGSSLAVAIGLYVVFRGLGLPT